MRITFDLIIIIPAFNEAKRIDIERFFLFMHNRRDVLLCFVDDGSTDSTIQILRNIQKRYPDNVKVLRLKKNRGKSNAVYRGVSYCLEKFLFRKIAYLDIDLSTSLEECMEISKYLNVNTEFVFASRVAKLDSYIKRKRYRFLIGRALATLISNQLKLKVYDTQCGCKVFSQDLSRQVFNKPFLSAWLFDVEIFHRILALYGRAEMIKRTKEVPLRSWVDIGTSKVKLHHFISIAHDFVKIGKNYSKYAKGENSELHNPVSFSQKHSI